jgi:hypothetical protein
MVMDTPTHESNTAAFRVGTAIATTSNNTGVDNIGGGSHGGRRLAIAHQIPLFLSLVSGSKQRARLVCHVIATVLLAFERPTKPDEGYVDPPDCQEDRGNPCRLLFLLLFQPGVVGVGVLLDGRLVAAADVVAAAAATATEVLKSLVVVTNVVSCLGRRNPAPSNVSFEIPPILPTAQKAIKIRII